MASVLKLMAELGLNASGFSKELKGAEQAAEKTTNSIKGSLGSIASGPVIAGLVALTAGVVGVTYALVKCAQAAGEEQSTILRLGAAVKASGGNWGEAQGAIESYLRAERTRTALDDGEGRESLIQLVTATGDYAKAMKLLPIVIDFARAKKMDLVSASELVGKVSQGETAMLQRWGIVLREGCSATEALIELQRRYAGQGEAFARSFQGQWQIFKITLDEIKEGIGYGFLPLLTKLAAGAAQLLQPLEAAIGGMGPLISDELLKIAQAVLPHGENLTASFAQGIVNGLPYVLGALKLIRMSIEYLLAPGSPPKLLPTLDEWGQGAAESWLSGWTTADFGMLSEMSGVLRGALAGLVAEGALGEAAVNPMLRSLRAQIAAAIEELRATGGISAATLGGFAGPTAGYAQAYLRSRAAGAEVTALEEKIGQATTAEEVMALAEQLDAARERAKMAKSQYELEEERLRALADESDLLKQQVDSTRDLAKAAKELQQAFDPEKIKTFADAFKGTGGKSMWDEMFSPEAMAEINKKAEGLAIGWVQAIMPILVPLRDLILGGRGTPEEIAATRGVAGKRRGGILGAISDAIDTMNSCLQTVKGTLEALAQGKGWQEALRKAGFTEEEIKSVDKMKTSVEGTISVMGWLTEAINNAKDAWRTFKEALGNINVTGSAGTFTPFGMPYASESDLPAPGHAMGFDGVVTGPVYIPAFGMVGEQGSERLTVTPLGKGSPGGTYAQYNTFNVYGIPEQVLAQARRDQRLEDLWGRVG